jgi:phage terminase large subunit-like protein
MGTTRSADLERLDISREVGWYLKDRGIPLPDCPPAIKTPEPSKVKGAKFDPVRVDKVLTAFRMLRHTQGRWAGQPLKPDPWQVAYILAPVFGWVRLDEDSGQWVRIINSLYVDIPRKNGKSTILGGIGLYLTGGDDEPGAQVIAAATGERQAGFVFQPVKQLAQSAPELKKHFKPYQKKVIHPRSGSYFEVVSSVADAQHGANIHGAVVDELHVHKDPDLVETIETGTGSRLQPLVAIITTADSGKKETIYDRKRTRVEQLASGTIVDPTTYGVVWCASADDDPFVEATWRKANPGFGISPTRAYLHRSAEEAKQSPADLAKFLRLHLGLRTKQETKYIDLQVWDRNASMVDEPALAGRTVYGGLDLASTSDLCALAWVFPQAGSFDVLWRMWLPESTLESLDRRTAGGASVWVREKLLTATPGDVVDYDYIRQQITADMDRFDVQEVAYDPWNATQLVNDLMADGAPMVQHRQGFASMSGPTKELARLLGQGTVERPVLRHGGNRAVRWQVDNFAVEMDAAGNVKPSKKHANDKIDAVVALVMALGRAVVASDTSSVYEDRGLSVV